MSTEQQGGPSYDLDVSPDAMRWTPEKPPPKPYVSRRDGRFAYSFEAIEHVEHVNCSKGCLSGAKPGSAEDKEFGPGGTCPILASVACGMGDVISELDDQGDRIVCLARQPRPSVPEPPRTPAVVQVAGQIELFEVAS